MKTIKTRTTTRGIKILDKSVSLSHRMKDSVVRTKERAEEAHQSGYSSPTEYASENIQNTTQGAVQETVHHLPNPRQKAQQNIEKAKNHFQEVKNQMPKERRRVAEEAQKTANKAQANSDKLQKTAEQAKETAVKTKDAVNEAKQTLREVRQTGRQTLREIKQGTNTNTLNTTTGTGNNTPAQRNFVKSRQVQIKTRSSIEGKTPEVNPRVSDFSPKTASNLPTNAPSGSTPSTSTVRTKTNFIKTKDVQTLKIKSGDASRLQTTSASPTPQSRGKLLDRIFNRNKGTSQSQTAKNTATKKSPSLSGGNSTPNATKSKLTKPQYLQKGVNAPKNTVDTAKNIKTATKQTAKTTKQASKGIKATTKGSIKAAKKSIKTAEKSAKVAVKTAKQTAKTAQQTAKAAAKSAQAAAKAAKIATKVAVTTAKAAVKATIALVKATIAAIKGLVALIAAGGWIAVVVILIVCLIGLLVGSVFGIFFSSEPSGDAGMTVNGVISEIDSEYQAKIDGIISSNSHDLLDMSGARAAWKQVLAVYTVRTVTDPDNPMEVATMDDKKADLLRDVFWDMNSISHTTDTVQTEEDVLDGDGMPTGEKTTVSKTVLRITVSHKTTDEMAAHYSFNDEQKEWLEELLKPDYHGLWNGLLYGITSIGDGTLLEIAETQLGNVGGEPYWKWYGFNSRVAWCACFVSWCAEQAGYIDAGIIPRFSLCSDGITWFKNRSQWQDGGYTPSPGDIIFFDWEGDGTSDHVGIVERVEGEKVHTIEGNTSDSCARRNYPLNSAQIQGYGIPQY